MSSPLLAEPDSLQVSGLSKAGKGKDEGEDGFQEAGGEKGGRKAESVSRQTSEGKQKLMKQDVATDGSLHTSKHGTLYRPPPPLGTKNRITPRRLSCPHGTVNHLSGS